MSALTFYLVFLMLAASSFILLPVLRYKKHEAGSQDTERDQQNRELFQQNIKEIEHSLAEKLIEQEEYEKLKLELERNFLNDMESSHALKQSSASRYTRLVPLVLILFIPVVSILFYRSVGSGPELAIPELIEELNTIESVDQQFAALTEIADILDQSFQRRTSDIQTGYTLGTLYISLEEYADAVRVFYTLSNELEDGPDKATVLGQLAQSQYLLADSTITPTVQNTIDEALLLNNNEQAIMSILAVEALLAEDLEGAANYWRRQVSQLPVGSEQVAQLNERIATLEAYLDDPEEFAESAQNAVELTVTVSIDESIQEQIAPGELVYIFARSEGTPPLAVLTFAPEDLPVTVTLNESMAMLPQFTLASVETAYVGANIAPQGQAVAESGDFQVLSDSFVITEQSDRIELVIKDRLP